MTGTARLTARQSAQLITALRHGRPLDEAAADLRLDLAAVWATARTDTRLVIALAGRDPDAIAEQGRTARAEYLRLLALGVAPSLAEQIMGGGHVGGWRGRDPAYAHACTAVREASALYHRTRQTRLTPERVARFLDELRTPAATVKGAAAAAGITPVAIYQRRRRDPEFAQAMDDARQSGPA
ncbi:hypothetical protein OG858_47265 (plasmid) [Streptomyces europaeiscabiei]|uniref:hypothetical protein n=1 Tax=Streptomyces europaeiscabiei TaxID=146819 RepID=UPI002E821FBE|nr:hypothetical protein [Streptomyces europaeiscabiei]WUD38800.1 hypothetical protein OG858_47265 [Streptomyces europaeiscabiei]